MKGFLHGKVQGSIIDMQDEHLISALRRAIGSSFAVSNLLDYEEDVDITATALIDRMSTERNFELWTIMHQFQVDFFMKMAFSDDPVYLTTNKDPSVMSGQKRNYHWWQWQALPVLERLLYKNPYLSSTGASSHWVKLATQKLHARKMEKDSPRKSDLLDKFIIAGEKHSDTVDPALILKTVSSTIGAGLDTTPFTMTAIIYYLIRNPSAYESLQRELNDAVRDGKLSSPIPKYVEADLLPYLAAVIKEAMRCWPFLSISLERVVPQGGAEICGHHLPQGTVVGCHPWVVHHDQYVFGEDVDVFRPERWLEGGKETAYVMEKSTLGFGSGKRGCLGRHIAELEMKKVIPALLLNFEVNKYSALVFACTVSMLLEKRLFEGLLLTKRLQMRIDNQETKLESMDGLTPFPKPIFVTFMRKQ